MQCNVVLGILKGNRAESCRYYLDHMHYNSIPVRLDKISLLKNHIILSNGLNIKIVLGKCIVLSDLDVH